MLEISVFEVISQFLKNGDSLSGVCAPGMDLVESQLVSFQQSKLKFRFFWRSADLFL